MASNSESKSKQVHQDLMPVEDDPFGFDPDVRRMVDEFHDKVQENLGIVKKVGVDDDDEVCCLCLDSYSKEQYVSVISPCKHVLHSHCYDGLKENAGNEDLKCPLCRGDINTAWSHQVRPPSPHPSGHLTQSLTDNFINMHVFDDSEPAEGGPSEECPSP